MRNGRGSTDDEGAAAGKVADRRSDGGKPAGKELDDGRRKDATMKFKAMKKIYDPVTEESKVEDAGFPERDTRLMAEWDIRLSPDPSDLIVLSTMEPWEEEAYRKLPDASTIVKRIRDAGPEGVAALASGGRGYAAILEAAGLIGPDGRLVAPNNVVRELAVNGWCSSGEAGIIKVAMALWTHGCREYTGGFLDGCRKLDESLQAIVLAALAEFR